MIVEIVQHAPAAMPADERHTVHVAGKNAWHGVRGVAASLAKFINTLVS